MPATATAPASETWIALRRGASHLGIGQKAFNNLLDARRIRVRRVPGGLPRVNLAEILALLEASTTQAVADVSAEPASSTV